MNVCLFNTRLLCVYLGAKDERSQVAQDRDRRVNKPLHTTQEQYYDRSAQVLWERPEGARDLISGKECLIWGLKTSSSQLKKRLRKGTGQRELEHP